MSSQIGFFVSIVLMFKLFGHKKQQISELHGCENGGNDMKITMARAL